MIFQEKTWPYLETGGMPECLKAGWKHGTMDGSSSSGTPLLISSIYLPYEGLDRQHKDVLDLLNEIYIIFHETQFLKNLRFGDSLKMMPTLLRPFNNYFKYPTPQGGQSIVIICL